ncbi:OmpA family protein [Candidatus Mesenet endosymbiont of Phosphuga atrata]|uniref:OmpA family protein n=1 Tax=Candidatus Mesenet endosymbiont of Phosphuga atrata TaxID=3066221 RepID=UPI0030D05882
MFGSSGCLIKSTFPMLHNSQKVWKVYFSCDKSEITDESKLQLLDTIEFLQINPDKVIKIIGYTDQCCVSNGRNKKKYNLTLGKRRADAIKEYIISCNQSLKYRIYTESKGESEPEIIGNDERAWSKNRRVVVVAS